MWVCMNRRQDIRPVYPLVSLQVETMTVALLFLHSGTGEIIKYTKVFYAGDESWKGLHAGLDAAAGKQ